MVMNTSTLSTAHTWFYIPSDITKDIDSLVASNNHKENILYCFRKTFLS
jgi:hypothetical protein